MTSHQTEASPLSKPMMTQFIDDNLNNTKYWKHLKNFLFMKHSVYMNEN